MHEVWMGHMLGQVISIKALNKQLIYPFLCLIPAHVSHTEVINGAMGQDKQMLGTEAPPPSHNWGSPADLLSGPYRNLMIALITSLSSLLRVGQEKQAGF